VLSLCLMIIERLDLPAGPTEASKLAPISCRGDCEEEAIVVEDDGAVESAPGWRRRKRQRQTSEDLAVRTCETQPADLTASAVPPESLDAVVASWDAMRSQLATLEATAREKQATWDSLLSDCLAAVGKSDAELELEQTALAVERYGDRAHLFCPLAPSIARLLPVSTHSPEEMAFAEELQEACGALMNIKNRLLAHITAAKERGDRHALRDLGPRHSALGKEIKALGRLDAKVGRRITLCARRIMEYRSRCVLREIDPNLLRDVEASLAGYTKVSDFYRLSDAARYSFGRQLDGPQHFTDVRRNVAILEVWNMSGSKIYGGYAVSGVDCPGERPNKEARTLFSAIEAEDGLGETYARDQDAEYKLCASFCGDILGLRHPSAPLASSSWSGRAVLFSKKPLCASCHDVVNRQLMLLLPGLSLQVVVDEAEAEVIAEPRCTRGRRSRGW